MLFHPLSYLVFIEDPAQIILLDTFTKRFFSEKLFEAKKFGDKAQAISVPISIVHRMDHRINGPCPEFVTYTFLRELVGVVLVCEVNYTF